MAWANEDNRNKSESNWWRLLLRHEVRQSITGHSKLTKILFEENFKNCVAVLHLKLALLLATAMYSQWTHESAAWSLPRLWSGLRYFMASRATELAVDVCLKKGNSRLRSSVISVLNPRFSSQQKNANRFLGWREIILHPARVWNRWANDRNLRHDSTPR